MNVGGNSDSIAKLTDCPDAPAPSRVIVNKFAVELGVVVGFRVTVICAHVVWAPESAVVVDARMVPEVV